MSRKKRKEKPPIAFLCPCCDYISLAEWGGNEICPVCFWENDGLDLDQLQSASPANSMLTLVQARANFEKIGTCDETWKTKVCSSEERSLYQRVPRRNEALLLRLVSDLKDLGIATDRGNHLFCVLMHEELDQLDEGPSAYATATDRRGFVVYAFGNVGVNDFIGLYLWVLAKPAVSDEFRRTIEQQATAIGLPIEIEFEFTDFCPGAGTWSRTVFRVSEKQQKKLRLKRRQQQE